MNYSQKTQDLIDRMCRNVERSDFELDKQKSEELMLKTYDLFGLKRPSKIKWCIDLLNKNFASSARSASSSSSASSASSALDYDFDWFIFSYEYCLNPDKEYTPNENDKKYLEYCELLMQAKEVGLGYRIEWKDTLYLVPTPVVKIDNQNRLHSINSPAIWWKNGEKIYFISGIKFDKELFEKLTQHKMSFAEILAIQDVDQRNQAMRFVGNEERDKFLEYVKAEIIDSEVKYTLEGKGIKYILYKLPKGEIFNEDTYAMWYQCPSTGLENFSGVPEFKTVAEAMAWKGSSELSIISPDDWEKSIPLVDES